MKRSIIIVLHLAYWLVYTFLTLSTLIIAGSNFKGSPYLSFFLNGLLAVSCFYTFYFFLVPRFLAARKIRIFALFSVITCTSASIIILLINTLFHHQEHTTITTSTSIFPMVINWIIILAFHFLVGLIHGLLATSIRGFITWYNEIHIKEQLEKKNTETEMALLKARINPHFLFNTLNNIDVLINHNAQMASLYLNKLSNLLRFALYDNRPERIPLEKELNIMREYIELESIRSTNKNFISFEVTGNPEEVSIAPMLFIPFLENAFKHSPGKSIDKAVQVRVDITADKGVTFFCRNLVGTHKQDITPGGGLGLELIKQRLELIYRDKHTLSVQKGNDYFQINLSLSTR